MYVSRLQKFILLFYVIFISATNAYATDTINIEVDFQQRNMQPNVAALRADINLQLSQIYNLQDWKVSNSIEPLKPTQANWIRITLHNQANVTQALRVLLHHPSLQQLDWFVVDDRQRIRRSLASGLNQPDYLNYSEQGSTSFPFTILPNETLSVYARIVDDGPLIIPLQLFSEQAYQEYLNEQLMWFWLLIGVTTAMLLYFLFSYVLLRSPPRFWLASALMASLMLWMTLNGKAGEWLNNMSLTAPLITVFLSLTLLALSKVSHTILQPVPIYWRWMAYLLFASLALSAWLLPLYWQLVSATALVASVLCVQLGLCIWLTHGPRRTSNVLLATGWLLITLAVLARGGLYLLDITLPDIWPFTLTLTYLAGLFCVAFSLAAFEQASHLKQLDTQFHQISELQQYRQRYEQAGEGLYSSQPDGTLLSINDAGARLFGYQSSQTLLNDISDVSQLYADPAERDILIHTLRHNKRLVSHQVKARRQDGQVFWLIVNAHLHGQDDSQKIVGTLADASDRQVIGPDTAYLNSHDGLTGLLNLQAFSRRLSHACEHAQQHQTGLSVIYINLLHFRQINQACGVEAGDTLLQRFSQLLHDTLSPRATLARARNDQFVIMLEAELHEVSEQIIHSLLDAIKRFRFTWGNTVFNPQSCFGVISYDADQHNPNDLVAMARDACQNAKQQRQEVHFFHQADDHTQQYIQDTEMNPVLQNALEHDQFTLFYHTIYGLKPTTEHQGLHYELLIRLAHNQKLVKPADFLPAAQRQEISSQIDFWVVRHFLQWRSEHLRHHPLFCCHINLSADSLADSRFEAQLVEALKTYQIEGSQLCFEISEANVLVNQQALSLFIQRLKRYGCRFAIDDFGSGFASHQLLRQLNIDYVKLDASLIQGVLDETASKISVKALCDIAHSYQIETIAEGVEHKEIMIALAQLGVDYCQGYAVSKPRPLQELIESNLNPT